MIFKPSSLPKLFFTYICPRFYGGAPSVPSNTTTTSTVNQSPWQNPVYQALMLGTADKPGPVTNMLNASNEQMAQWNAINKTGLTREAQAGLGTWNPTISAGTSTLVDKVNQDTGKYETIVNPSLYQKDSAGHYTPTPQAYATDELKNTYQTYLGRAPDAPGQAYWLDSYKRGVPSNDITASIAGSDEAKAYAAKNAAKYAPISATTSQDVANSVADFRNARQAPAAPAAPAPGAAQGGLMGLRGYASGGEIQKAAQEALGRPFSDFDTNQLMRGMPGASYDQILKYFKSQPEGVKYAATQAAKKPSAAEIKKFVADNMGNPKLIASKAKEFGLSNQDLADATGYNLNDVNNFLGSPTGQAPYGLMDTLSKTAYFDPVTGKSTLPDFLAIQEKVRNLETPAQFKAATDMYGQSSAGLAAAANYKPTNISASKADVANAAATSYQAQNMKAPTDIAAQRGKVFGVDATSYQAQNMKAPTDIKALDYDAAQANAAQLDRSSVRDIAAQQAEVERYKAEMMRAPSDISSQNYQAALADLNQMQGPKSWIDKGTSEAYMSPYMQNVVDIQKREANRDYAKQLQELNKQATAAGAYGGSRQAIERSEAARNQATRLGDIEAQGLEKAYQSGMGQFSAEQGLGLQAGQANLSAAQQTAQQNQAATNQQRSQYIQQALQAAQVNYGGQLTAAQQNQVAQNAASQFNASAQNLANNNYSAQQLQAQQANQGVDFNVGQMNTTNQQQTSLANQTATNQQRALYVQQALQAAQVNYGGQLTAAQQNQVAQNASAQYNATNQQQANLSTQQAQNQAEQAYVQQALQAAQVNYGGQLTAAQQNQVAQNASAQYNATNAQNVNLANANAANTANNAYAQNQLQAQQANQTAGLQANQQGIAALQGVGQNASGLAQTGSAQNTANLANLGAAGQVAQAEQNLGQQYLDTQTRNAQSWLNMPTSINAGASNVVNAQPVQGGTAGTTSSSKPASWARGGLIKNGKVSKRGKK